MTSAFAANNNVDNNTVGSKMTIAISQGEIKDQVDRDVTAFYGIPYANNPFTSALRFKAPKPYKKWEGVLDATEKTACPSTG